MRFKKSIKRIAALGTGAVMVGASLMGASAADHVDLAKYPSQYIQDGKFTGVMVVGDKAAAQDVIGVSDIAISLQAAAVKKVSSGTSTSVTVDGEAWKVGTNTRILEISENLNTGTNQEAIANITNGQFIDDQELPNLLAQSVVSNSKGTADFDQRMFFEDANAGYVIFTEDDADVTADFLYFPNTQQIARYELEFTTSLESDVDNDAGSASSTGLVLTDMEDIEINILGQPYSIVRARRVTTLGNSVELTLMGGSNRDTLLEGETKTYNINGQEYEVTLNFVDADEAQFTVNGETTQKINDGDTDILSDGTTMGISDILYQDYAGGVHSATFFIGANKIELKDTNIADTASSDNVEIDEEDIDDAAVIIEGSDDNSTFKIDRISINMTAEDDLYVPAGGKLSESPDLDEPEVLFTEGWDISYEGLSVAQDGQNRIKIDASGSDDYEIEFVDGRGNPTKFPVANSPGASNIRFGDDDDDLIMRENRTITKDDYFIITDETDEDGERVSFALRYKGADKITNDNPVLKFDELGSGERVERPISPETSQTAGDFTNAGVDITELAQIKLGGSTWAVYNVSAITSDDFDIIVDHDASGAIDTNAVVNINSKCGAKIEVYNTTSYATDGNLSLNITNTVGVNVGILVNVTTPNTDHFDDLTPSAFNFNITADANGEVRMSKHADQNHNYIQPDDEDDTEYAYSSYGAYAKFDSPTSDPQEVEIWYPCEQNVPIVHVVGSGASISTVDTAGEGDTVVVQKIDVGATKLASEVADIMSVSSILVGGPCANAAAATVLGNPADCAAGFKPGVGKVELVGVGEDNVAMLVAGYSAEDTRNAAQVVANYKDFAGDLEGAAVEVTSEGGNLKVSEPTVEEVVEEEEAAEEEAEESEEATEDAAEEEATEE